MPKQVQLRRGTTAQTAAFTGAQGEVTINTDQKRVVVHDGSTAGGIPHALESEVLKKTNNLSEISGTANRASARANIDSLWADDIRGLDYGRSPRGGLYFNNTAAYLVTGTNGLNSGTSDLTLHIVIRHSTYIPTIGQQYIVSHASGNNRFVFGLQTNGSFFLTVYDGAGTPATYTFAPDVALEAGKIYAVTFTWDRDGLGTLYINAISDRDKNATGVTASVVSTSAVDIGNGNATTYRLAAMTGTMMECKVFNYLVAVADLSNLIVSATLFSDQWGSVTNLVDSSTLNGGFETAGGGGADAFASWSETVAGTTTITRDTAEFHGGAASCKFTIDASGSLASISAPVGLVVGRRYRLSFWAKVDNSSSGPILSTDIGGVATLSTSWTQHTLELVATLTYLNIKRSSNCASRVIYIDDVVITEIGAILDVDLENANPTNSLTVRDRSSNANHGTLAASGVSQVNPVKQGNFVDGITVGGSGVLKKILTATAALDFGSIAAGASADLTIAVTGAAVNDSVSLGPPPAPTAGIIFEPFVSATNTVTVRATNITGGAIDPASQTFRVTVFSF